MLINSCDMNKYKYKYCEYTHINLPSKTENE